MFDQVDVLVMPASAMTAPLMNEAAQLAGETDLEQTAKIMRLVPSSKLPLSSSDTLL